MAFNVPHSYFNTPTVPLVLGTAAGGLLGRYLVSPLLSGLLGLDSNRSKNLFTLLGALAGSVPGIEMALLNKKLRGGYFTPYPNLFLTDQWTLQPSHKYYGGTTGPGALEKQSSAFDDRAFWRPTFPVSIALDEVSRNPNPGLIERVKLKQLIIQAGKEQGVGLSGLASPGALFSAATKFTKNTLPPVGAAYLAAGILGAPKKVRRTAVGGALLYGALKTLTKENSEYKLERDKSKKGVCHYRTIHKGTPVGFLTSIQQPDNRVMIIGLYVAPKHRRKGLAKSLLATVAKDNKGKVLMLKAKEFSDKPLKGEKLIRFYESAGFNRIGKTNNLYKLARRMEDIEIHLPIKNDRIRYYVKKFIAAIPTRVEERIGESIFGPDYLSRNINKKLYLSLLWGPALGYALAKIYNKRKRKRKTYVKAVGSTLGEGLPIAMGARYFGPVAYLPLVIGKSLYNKFKNNEPYSVALDKGISSILPWAAALTLGKILSSVYASKVLGE